MATIYRLCNDKIFFNKIDLNGKIVNENLK